MTNQNNITDYNKFHYSVMKSETIDCLDIKPDGVYVDCTTGAGGHSYEIASRLSEKGRLICFDQDINAINLAKKRLEEFQDKVTFVNANFQDVWQILKNMGIEEIDGAVIDLGVSSMQLNEAERGFAYMKDGPLSMTMNPEQEFTAYNLVNEYSEKELERVLRVWGEEKFSSRIARKIIETREEAPIKTTLELAAVIDSAIPMKAKKNGGHPAKRSFQAIRIETNSEITIIEPTLRSLVDILKKGGILAVISFHSLEDRVVKHTLASYEGRCTCPPDFPVCVCGCKAVIKASKPISPTKEELEINPPSHSAKLRYAVKL